MEEWPDNFDDYWPDEIEAREVLTAAGWPAPDPERVGAALMQLAEMIPEVRVMLERFVRKVVEGLARIMAEELPSQPSLLYKAAGSPYGRNRKGKKRWLLELKREAREV